MQAYLKSSEEKWYAFKIKETVSAAQILSVFLFSTYEFARVEIYFKMGQGGLEPPTPAL